MPHPNRERSQKTASGPELLLNSASRRSGSPPAGGCCRSAGDSFAKAPAES